MMSLLMLWSRGEIIQPDSAVRAWASIVEVNQVAEPSGSEELRDRADSRKWVKKRAGASKSSRTDVREAMRLKTEEARVAALVGLWNEGSMKRARQ
jgi:hypothetical protein